jgi:NAD(P)-dependent dehydrogenase (short-subunit alcohol dehydrogenase family)
MGAHGGKVAVVTGGAKGIGRGCVERFVRDGANVVIADVDVAAARALERELGAAAYAVACDVTDEASVEAMVAAAVERFGGIDYAVNNAGIIMVSPLVDTDYARWKRLMDVNVNGIFLTARATARQMIRQGRGGVIVNGSSGAGRHGVPNFSHYCASKAAIIMMSQALAQELAPHRIRVNCYTPGHIETPLWNDIADGFAKAKGMTREQVVASFLEGVPWGRFGKPADVANAVSWLCTDEAEYVSGQCIAMNGAQLPW